MSSTENISLEDQVNILKAQLAAIEAAKNKGFKGTLKHIGRGIWAAVASTDSVKKEKSLAALIVTRVLINIGASAATVDLVKILLETAGVKF